MLIKDCPVIVADAAAGRKGKVAEGAARRRVGA